MSRGLKLLHCLELEAPRLFSPEPEDAGMARLRDTLGRGQRLSPRSRPAAGFWAVTSYLQTPSKDLQLLRLSAACNLYMRL